MKKLEESGRSTSNNVAINVVPSDFKYVEISQTMGAETTLSITVTRGITISHKFGNVLSFRGQK